MEHFLRGAVSAKQIIVIFNGHMPQVQSGEPLRSFLSVTKNRRSVRLIVPGDWIIPFLREEGVPLPPRILKDDQVSHLPTCVLTAHRSTFAAHFFSVSGNNTVTGGDARKAWRWAARTYVWPPRRRRR